MTKNLIQSFIREVAILSLVVSLLIAASGFAMYQAFAATTNMDLAMSAGALSITSSGTATLAGKTVSTAVQTSTGSITSVNIADERGSGAGWSAVVASQHFTTKATHRALVDTDSDGITGFTGAYDGLDGVIDPNGTFIVEVTTGGAVGTAVFKWTDPAGNLTSGVTTAVTNALSNGITVDWTDAATYDVGDKFSAAVDVFPYTGLTVTPGTITAVSGSLTGVTAGSAGVLTGSSVTSDSKTLMTAAVNAGFGNYTQAPSLSLNIHANSLSGSFVADATITVS